VALGGVGGGGGGVWWGGARFPKKTVFSNHRGGEVGEKTDTKTPSADTDKVYSFKTKKTEILRGGFLKNQHGKRKRRCKGF